MKNYSSRKYSIEEYDPTWANIYNSEKEKLARIFGELAIDIQHVGSTAVVGLAGKPTIDILIVVANIENVDALNKDIASIGYLAMGAYISEDSRLFAIERDNRRIVNVHVFPINHPHIEEMIFLRDYLMSHPKIRDEYSELKRHLFATYPDNYGKYRMLKDEYFKALMKRIRV